MKTVDFRKESFGRGYVDSDGMMGHYGDIIESGGNKISPIEIEEVAIICDIVEDFACIPVDTNYWEKTQNFLLLFKKVVTLTI